MRYEAFWLAVIGLALAAIVAGYASGESSAQLPRRPAAAPGGNLPPVRAVLHDPSDAAVDDLFSLDDVVVDRSAPPGESRWSQPVLAVVVGLCGYSDDAAERFVQLPIPLAFDIDPSAPDAARVAELAREAHDLVLVHLADAPTQTQLAALRRRLGGFDGLASRNAPRFVQTLDGTGLLFFDERGDADAAEFRGVGITFTRRDVTVDDRTDRGYVRYMLARTVQRSERAGPLVVLMRPAPHSYSALAALQASRSVEFVPLTQQS
jgi:polysaccharide deacetylase 2 family uncharacterized protein YibQ